MKLLDRVILCYLFTNKNNLQNSTEKTHTLEIEKKEIQHHTIININGTHIRPKRCWDCTVKGHLQANCPNVQYSNVTKTDILFFLIWISIYEIPSKEKSIFFTRKNLLQ